MGLKMSSQVYWHAVRMLRLYRAAAKAESIPHKRLRKIRECLYWREVCREFKSSKT